MATVATAMNVMADGARTVNLQMDEVFLSCLLLVSKPLTAATTQFVAIEPKNVSIAAPSLTKVLRRGNSGVIPDQGSNLPITCTGPKAPS